MNDIPMFGRRQKSSRIRDSREQSLSIRVTKNEEKILLAAAEKNQQPLREWLRDVALKAAQNTEPDPTFTEVVYSRNAILSLLQMVALKSGVAQDTIARSATSMRQDKHQKAVKTMEEYAQSASKEE